jgi:undecaprenyl-diphosphatase
VPNLSVFFRRRFEPGAPYGLSLTLGLGVSLLALGLFLLILFSLPPDLGPTPFDSKCAAAMKEHAEAHPLFVAWARLITDVGGVPALVTLGVLGAITLWVTRQRLLAVGWVVATGGGGLLNYGLKTTIDRPRPPVALRDAAIFETNESFPSGHSMGSVIGFGVLGYLAILRLRRTGVRVAIITGLGILVPLIGCSRFYLRAHWFTDVLGGFAIGTFWLALCITGMEILRLRGELQAPTT